MLILIKSAKAHFGVDDRCLMMNGECWMLDGGCPACACLRRLACERQVDRQGDGGGLRLVILNLPEGGGKQKFSL